MTIVRTALGAAGAAWLALSVALSPQAAAHEISSRPSCLGGRVVIDGADEDSPENSPDDVVVYAHAAGAVIVNLALGTASGADGNDTLRNIDHVIGSAAADSLTGNSGDNVLAG